MANPSRRKRKRKASVVGAVLKLLFVLFLLSMLAAYIANQVALSSKKAELDTLQEQIEQQKTQNEEMQRILSGDSDDVTEWVARDSYNYAAANERIFVDVCHSGKSPQSAENKISSANCITSVSAVQIMVDLRGVVVFHRQRRIVQRRQ